MTDTSTPIDTTADELGEEVAGARSRVRKGVAAAKERLQDVGGEITERVKTVGGEMAGRAGDYAKEGYDAAKVKIGHGYDRARKDFDQLSTDVNAYVRDNPGRSVLIAAGVGFLVGFLLRGDRRR